MDRYSIDQAQSDLPRLIDRALAGEAVVIERDGKAVELRPVAEPRPASGPVDWSWIERRRNDRGRPLDMDAGAFVSRMRDDEQR